MATAKRSLVGVGLDHDGAGNPVLALQCDCGTTTEIALLGWTPDMPPTELAYTCDGCRTSHWFVAAPDGA